MASPGYHEDQEDDDDDDGGVYQPGYIPDQFEKKRHSKKVEFIILIEWIALFSILGFLIVSLTVDKLSSLYVSGLRIWRWCVLVLVIFEMYTDNKSLKYLFSQKELNFKHVGG